MKKDIKTNKLNNRLKNRLLRLIAFVFLCSVLGIVNSQAQVMISAKMDTSMLLIGDQTRLRLEATFPDSLMVSMPVFSDTIIDKLEIIDISGLDSLMENGMVTIYQSYLVTSFDSGWYSIPALDFTIAFPKSNRIDTIQSVPLYFGVLTMPLDTANANAITDIKAPMGAPITFKEIAPFLGIGLGIILLAVLAYVLYKKFAKKEPIFVKKEKPKEPAHLIAFRDLDALKNEKLWQKGLVKEYYSRLTEVIRVYIEDRWEILAMESTTDEIMEAFRSKGEIDRAIRDELSDTLVRADFVKFAKSIPMADENEKSMNFAYSFVSKTKLVEVLREEDEKEIEKEVV